MLLSGIINLIITATRFLFMTSHSSNTQISDCTETGTIEVNINDGKIMGTTLPGERKRYCAFMGIPFAEPPIKDLRFRPPRPMKPWNGTLDATKSSRNCMQFPLLAPVSEDCLYINVYTPELPFSNETLMTVIVFIHGGEFYLGDGGISSHNPSYFIDRGVVFITFNYRVGAFGFLSTEDDEAPGNYGMKDQVLALKWAQQNIHHFGGDPDKVTIFGQSAGAASVHYHMMSPLTKGMFRHAISNAGTIFMPWARNSNPKKTAEKQAQMVGCPTQPTSEMIACLREVPATTIRDSIFGLFGFFLLPSTGYCPVVEKETDQNPEPYLTHDPIELVMNGSFQRVPWLMGNNAQSIGFLITTLFNVVKLRDELKSAPDKLFAHIILREVHENDKKLSIYEKIKKFYGIELKKFKSHVTEEELKTVINIASDRAIIHGVHKAALAHSLLGHKPIYKYNIAFRGHFSTTMLTSIKNYGASHSDDLLYLFKDFEGSKYPFTRNEKELSDLLVSLWTNFAKYGNPVSKNASEHDRTGLIRELEWEPIGDINKNNIHVQYLNIGQVEPHYPRPYTLLEYVPPVKLNMAVNLYKERMDFWDSLPIAENFPNPN